MMIEKQKAEENVEEENMVLVMMESCYLNDRKRRRRYIKGEALVLMFMVAFLRRNGRKR